MADELTSPPAGQPPEPVKLPNGETVKDWQAWAANAVKRTADLEAARAAEVAKSNEYRARVVARIRLDAVAGRVDEDGRELWSQFVDVDPETLAVDLSKFERALKSARLVGAPPAVPVVVSPGAPSDAIVPVVAAPGAPVPPPQQVARVVPGHPGAATKSDLPNQAETIGETFLRHYKSGIK